RYAAPARRVARAVLADPDDADDAAQDALLAALVKLQQYDPRRPFGPWLMRIVANAATDRRRRRSVRRAEPLDPNATAGGPRPDVQTERRALGQRLREALAELPERRRVAVVLFDVARRARALGSGRRHRSRAHRAGRRLLGRAGPTGERADGRRSVDRAAGAGARGGGRARLGDR